MSDKVIIDGVDVSECKNFSCSICTEENKIPRTIGHFTADCEFYPNCYYKQLKRLKAENEELKKRNEELDKMTGIYSYRLMERYKQSLEEVREINEEFFDMNYGFDEQDISYDVKEVARKIQDKINEVFKDENH